MNMTMKGKKSTYRDEKQDEAPSPEELKAKVNEYVRFIDHTLHPQLKIAITQREDIEKELHEYQQLKDNLTRIQLSESSLGDHDRDRDRDRAPMVKVDLGHETIYCRAKFLSPDRIFLSIGMGFHTELTIDEALKAIDLRMNFLSTEKLPKRVENAKTVAGHLEAAMDLLQSLGEEMRMRTR